MCADLQFLEGTEQGDAQDNTSSSMLGTRHEGGSSSSAALTASHHQAHVGAHEAGSWLHPRAVAGPLSRLRRSTSRSEPGAIRVRADAMEDTGSAPLPFEILDYTPDWDFTTGGAKLIVTCSFTDQTNLDVSNARLHVMFDNEQVLATVLRPGVIRVYVPPHDAGSVDLRLTFGDGRARSCSHPFTYRVAPQALRGADNTCAPPSLP